ncbi:hypothetical protein [Sphingomonas sp. MMS24-J13]|uniref:hypothetical protein n=1 Tax=Sphingomonas sp. MMS24-J13 TaxID=3238686 RepID=UPI00384AE247
MARNNIINGRMEVIEDDFDTLERALNASSNSLSIGSDLAVLALNGLAATTGGSATKAALAAASGGIVGAQGAVNKDLYFKSTLPALLARMEANRATVKARIAKGMTLPDAQYPLKVANGDLKELVRAGSIASSVNKISQEATTSKQASDDLIAATRSLAFTTSDSAVRLRAWLSPNGQVDPTHYAALQAWLDKQPEPFLNGQGYPPAMLVSGDTANGNTLEPIRLRALQDPTLKIGN